MGRQVRITTEEVTNFINRYYNKKFCWGSNDCSTFIRDYLETFTGKDLSRTVSFCWETKRQAIKYYLSMSTTLEELISSNVDIVKIENIHNARLGDIFVLDFDGWHTAAIMYHTNRLAMFVEHVGLKLVPIENYNTKTILRVK